MRSLPLEDFYRCAAEGHPPHWPLSVTSISERVVVSKGDKAAWVAACQRQCARQVARVYPMGARVSSDNFNPLAAWGAGCQVRLERMPGEWSRPPVAGRWLQRDRQAG